MMLPRFFIIVCCLLLTACSGVRLDSITATPRPATSTPFQTPTPVWFPATATHTPQAIFTQPATPEMLTGLNGVMVTDDFSDSSTWDTATSDEGSATLSRDRLTLAVKPGVYLISLQRELVLGDFYAEITARPSLCRDADEYGFLVRGNAATYYRFSLTCNGQIHAERISLKERHDLHEFVPSGDVPPGAPSEVRIGVWAVGPELRLFLNGRFQFSITDLNLSSGTVGVFARSLGETPVTVTFSDLVVQTVNFKPPTKTAVPD
ncbi:MAG: hypothetical protein QGM50_06200 [Anaerolineae bacterium]|nr:hypothetical protein [Anaerolineae bacterium]MDK1081089.1 hypothetical protein [Anaerolineae bacterium]MDK1118369.1 hypothetical protein [Anaerolineae bacterium]